MRYQDLNILECVKLKASKLNLTIKDLEKKSGLGKNTISSWKNRSPSFDKILKVCDALNCSVDELLGCDIMNVDGINQKNKSIIIDLIKILKERQDE